MLKNDMYEFLACINKTVHQLIEVKTGSRHSPCGDYKVMKVAIKKSSIDRQPSRHSPSGDCGGNIKCGITNILL